MNVILSAIILLAAIMDAVLGLGFFLNPVSSAASFGLEIGNAYGVSTVRGDMTAFFVVAAVFMAWAAWKRRGELLLAPILLYGIAFTGRLVDLFVNGAYDGWWIAMAIEAGHVLVMAMAMRAWGGFPRQL